MSLRGWAQGRLESGAFDGPLSRGAGSLWRRWADPVRPLRLPAGVRVVGIGGATLGGAGKTPLVLELARRLAARGERVAVVAPGYRARPERARRVAADDCVDQVGDEALMLARALAPSAVPVVVAPTRQAALDMAAGLAPLVLVDGLLQARPARLALSLLVLDASQPWGAGRCPPSGDLRADRVRLLAACDAVVLSGSASCGGCRLPETGAGRPLFEVPTRLLGARMPDGRLAGVEELARRPLGLTLAIARPGRVAAALRQSGVEPVSRRIHADHAVPVAPGPGGRPDAWLATAKCATKLGREHGGAPVWVLEQALEVPEALVSLVARKMPDLELDVRGLCPEKPC